MALTKVTRSGITDDSINADKIADGTVVDADLAAGTITASKLASTLDLSSKTVTLPNTSVTNAMLSGSIANAKLANSSLTINGSAVSLGGSISAGSISWQSVVTGDTTMVAGRGYFVNTTSGAITMTLPASASAGDTIAIKDYAGTFASNKLTIARNSHKIQGATNNSQIGTARASVVLVYIDATKGWLYTNESNVADLATPLFTEATGGTVSTSGDYKIHTFTGDGCFAVSQIGNGPTVPTGGPVTVSYMVVAGGGGNGPAHWSGGAGAGGFREGRDIGPSYTASPLVAPAGLTITATTYPVTVGAGGDNTSGSPSVFSTITSAGGGYGGRPGSPSPTTDPLPGGSGAGNNPYDKPTSPVGNGNTPPVSPPQGNPGGTGLKGPQLPGRAASGGGGGAGGAGGNAQNITPTYPGSCSAGRGGQGGAGVVSNITGSPVSYAGGGAGSAYITGEGGVSHPVKGGGGVGGIYNPQSSYSGDPKVSTNGSANTGGGAGSCDDFDSNNGGKGIVVIRYKFQ